MAGGWRDVTRRAMAIAVGAWLGGAIACGQPPPSTTAGPPAAAAIDPQLASTIAAIRAVDHHTHVNSTAANDTDFDALPIDGLPPFDLPSRARPDNPEWIAALKSLYGYPHNDMSEAHLADLRQARAKIVKEQGDRFPAW